MEGTKRHRAQQLHVRRVVCGHPQPVARPRRPHLEQEHPHDHGAAEKTSRRPDALARGDPLLAQVAQLAPDVLDPSGERMRPLFGSSQPLDEARHMSLVRV